MTRIRFQFSLRTFLLALTGMSCIGGLLLSPIADISAKSVTQIKTGMTMEEGIAVIGDEPGTYDGVQSCSNSAPLTKLGEPSELRWVGGKGEIVLNLGVGDRVKDVSLYPHSSVSHSWKTWALERILRRRGGSLKLWERFGITCAFTAAIVFLPGRRFVPAAGPNIVAKHGAIGMIVCFSLIFVQFANTEVGSETSILLLIAAFTGGWTGIVVGWLRSRRVVPTDDSSEPKKDSPVNAQGS